MAYPNCTLSNAINFSSAITWSDIEKAIILIFLPPVTFFGNIGNLAFLYTSVRIPRMRTVANLYLLSLAMADVLFISTVCAQYLWTYALSPIIRQDIFQSDIGCWLTYSVSAVTYYASVQMIALVSVERYYAICHPMKHLGFTGKKRTMTQIAICWIIAIFLGMVGSLKYKDLRKRTYCVGSIGGEKLNDPHFITFKYCSGGSGHDWLIVISGIITNTVFLVALISSSFTYVKIIQALTKRGEANLQSNQDTTNSEVRKQVAIMLMVNGIIFFICQIPHRLFGVYRFTSDVLNVRFLEYDQQAQFTVISYIFLYINSAINPYVYIVGSRYYRKAFMEALGLSSRSKRAAKTPIAVSNMNSM